MKHNFREQDTPNADQSRTPNNTHSGASSVAEGLQKFDKLIPEKHRSDAVLCIEYLITGSPEVLQAKTRLQQDRYFSEALSWVTDRHGAENVVCASVHRDETTPHLVVYVVPLDTDSGRLNCKKWLGGAKALNQMQTDFAKNVGLQHGLERGVEGSKAKHTSIKEYYARVTEPTPVLKQPAPLKSPFLESKDDYANRIFNAAAEAVNPKLTAQAAKIKEAEQYKKNTEITLKSLSKKIKEIEPVSELFKGLSPDQQQAAYAQLTAETNKMRGANIIAAEAKRRALLLLKGVELAMGATATFCRHAVAALREKANDWTKVEWVKVEKAAVVEAVNEHGQSHTEAAQAVLTYSPGQASTTKQMTQALLARAAQLDKEHERTKKPEEHRKPGFDLGR